MVDMAAGEAVAAPAPPNGPAQAPEQNLARENLSLPHMPSSCLR